MVDVVVQPPNDPKSRVYKSNLTQAQVDALALDFTVYTVTAGVVASSGVGPTRALALAKPDLFGGDGTRDFKNYPGPPVGVVTPDFIGQRCQDTTTGLFYVAGSTTAYGWSLLTQGSATRKAAVPGGVFCDWSSYYGTLAMVSTDAADDIALDTTAMLDGLPTAKCTFTSAASGTFIADYTFTNAVSLKNFRTIQVPLRITGNDSGNTGAVATNTTPFQLWLTLSGGGTVRLQCDATNVPPNTWHVFSWSRESPSGLVTFAGGATAWSDLDSQTITKIRIVQATSNATSNNYPVWVGPVRCDAMARGCVTIVMDGQYSSQYSIIKPILDRYGFKTSIAVVNSDIGGTGRMTLAQLDQMYDEGHEMIHHTYDGSKTNGYINATDWPTAASISDDIRAQWEFFKDNGWLRGIGKAVNAFANPFTSSASAARQKLMYSAMLAAGVQCSRASTALYTSQVPLGYSGVKPWHLRGAIQITNTDTASGVQTVIDQAEANGEWAIITVHRAVASSPGSLEMTTANFETWLPYLASRVAAGNVDVLPLGEAYDRYFSA